MQFTLLDSRGDLETRYVHEVYSVGNGSPIPNNELIRVQLNGNTFTHGGFTYVLNRNSKTFLQCICERVKNCSSVILLSSFHEQGLNLAFLGNTVHSHYTVSLIRSFNCYLPF